MKAIHSVMTALLTLAAAANTLSADAPAGIVYQENFESVPWKGNAWQGEGKITITSVSPAQGATSLYVEGVTADARAQAFSPKIPVTPGATYRIDCQYRATSSTASLSVRWQGDKGVAYRIKGNAPDWTALSGAIAGGSVSVTQYNAGFGKQEDSLRLYSNSFIIPPDVTEISIFVTVYGQGAITVDAVSLVKE